MSPISQGTINAAFNKAVESYEAGNVDKAKSILQFLTRLAPTEQGVWLALAQCHDEAGEPEVADNLRWLGRHLAEVTL